MPLYQDRGLVVTSDKRLKEDSFAKDTSRYYSWFNEIQKVEMSGVYDK